MIEFTIRSEILFQEEKKWALTAIEIASTHLSAER
jgi:hypothetical protein